MYHNEHQNCWQFEFLFIFDGIILKNLSPSFLAPTQSWTELGKPFHQFVNSELLPQPYWIVKNYALAQQLGLPSDWLDNHETLEILSGNFASRSDVAQIWSIQPTASVYSGHQFGVWAGQLGDGRAMLIGEIKGGQEIQLKGAGPTPYSRRGDGRAVLRSSIREYLCSEAMHYLGIPTTRALSLVGSDLTVMRETPETAAVVARVAPSFIRFGNFEHFSFQNNHQALQTLADYVIKRFYPECQLATTEQEVYSQFLSAVCHKTAVMIAKWQAVGFCHGVMNTDNMSILGLTLDYGPFKMLDGFDPDLIFNHSDTNGRYTYNQQASIAFWNLHCLAEALLPLIQDIDATKNALETYREVYSQAFLHEFGAKLGLDELTVTENDRPLIHQLLRLLSEEKIDYTWFWQQLAQTLKTNNASHARDLFIHRENFDVWHALYLQRLQSLDLNNVLSTMGKSNPRYILRNHLAQIAIEKAQLGDYSEINQLLEVLQNPYQIHSLYDDYARPAPAWAGSIEISCSS